MSRRDTRRRWLGRRLLTGACAAALLVSAPATMAAPATPPLTFIDALAAIPEATKARALAWQVRREAGARQLAARSGAGAARLGLGAATSIVHETSAVLSRADVALAQAQDAIDDAARAMYSSGGTLPTFVDVILTADSELGLARSMVMRQYLASVGDRVVLVHEHAQEARRLAAAAAATALARRDLAASASVIAEADLAAATSDLASAEADLVGARTHHRRLMRLTRVDRSDEYGRLRTCGDWLTRLLSRSGFEGENLREAWAIVMRESGGRADSVSETGDLGLFQINTDTWEDEEWFDRALLLTRRYNAQVARQLSRGGRTWYSWGLDGHGRPDPGAYVKAGWTDQRITSQIVIPYIQWYALYPCRPAYEEDAVSRVPTPLPSVEGVRTAVPSTSPR